MRVGTLAKISLFLVVAILLSVSPAIAQEPPVVAQGPLGNAFTYQGRLTTGGLPANGSYDFAFSLWDSEAGGTQQGATVEVGDLAVANGLFTAPLDFGSYTFTGDERWLEVGVRPGAASGADPYTTLTPRTKLNAAPYALGLRPGAIISRDGGGFNLSVSNGSPGGLWIISKKAIEAWTSSGTALWGAASTGTAVYGIHTDAASTDPAIYGRTNSTAIGAVAVLGEVGPTAPGAYSAAVRGINNGTGGNGIGVWGSQAGSGWGVYGTSATGVGVYAVSGGSARFQTALRASNNNTSGGMAAYITNNSDFHTAHFANAGVGGVLYLQNDGNAAGVGGGDFITAMNSDELDTQFRVDSAGNVTADGSYTSPAADFAEMLPAADGLEPGDLLAIGPDGSLIRAVGAYATNVAGVYSTDPGFVGGASEEGDDPGKVPLAIVGIVPAKVSAENGAIAPGDLLTTSDTPGHAMKATDRDLMLGAIVGKALEGLESGTGVIQILVTLQ